MMGGASTAKNAFADGGTPALAKRHQSSSSEITQLMPDKHEGITMRTSFERNRAFNRGEQTAPPHCADWLRDYLSATPAKIIANEAGINLRAAESVKMGRNGLHMNHLVNMCRANPDFRAAFFQFCGGTLEGEPEMVAALSRAINAVVRARQ